MTRALFLALTLAGCFDDTEIREYPDCADLGCPIEDPLFCRADGVCLCPTDAGPEECVRE